jgi:hypothetical protein
MSSVDPGLCASCAWARRVAGARSIFWLCERSRTDPRFPRYPRLPVVGCRGYTSSPGPGERGRAPP